MSKPILIFETLDDKVILTKSRLEEIVELAYQAGLTDGKNIPTYTPYWGITNSGTLYRDASTNPTPLDNLDCTDATIVKLK